MKNYKERDLSPPRSAEACPDGEILGEFADRCVVMEYRGQGQPHRAPGRPGQCIQERYHVWRWTGWRYPLAETMCQCGKLSAPWMKHHRAADESRTLDAGLENIAARLSTP